MRCLFIYTQTITKKENDFMLFDTKIEHRTEPKRPIPEMLKEYQELLESTGRPGVKRLLGWLQSDMGNGLSLIHISEPTRRS